MRVLAKRRSISGVNKNWQRHWHALKRGRWRYILWPRNRIFPSFGCSIRSMGGFPAGYRRLPAIILGKRLLVTFHWLYPILTEPEASAMHPTGQSPPHPLIRESTYNVIITLMAAGLEINIRKHATSCRSCAVLQSRKHTSNIFSD